MDTQIAKRQEERKHIKNGYVEYRAPGRGLSRFFKSQQKRGLLVNVTKNGLAFRTSETIAEGSKLQIALVLPGHRTPVQVQFEVIWQRQERKVGTVVYTHVIGGRFTEYSPEAWQTLNEFMKEQ